MNPAGTTYYDRRPSLPWIGLEVEPRRHELGDQAPGTAVAPSTMPTPDQGRRAPPIEVRDP